MNKPKSRNSFNLQNYFQDRLDYSRLQKPGKTLMVGDNQYVGYQPPKSKTGETYTMVGQRAYDPGPGGSGDGNKGTNRSTAYIPIWQRGPVGAATTAPASEPVVPAPQPYTPSELQINEPTSTAPTPAPSQLPEVAPMQYAPGGASLMIGGNATNFRRKYSTARLSGAASRGTSQFRINNTGVSSSLNIGV